MVKLEALYEYGEDGLPILQSFIPVCLYQA